MKILLLSILLSVSSFATDLNTKIFVNGKENGAATAGSETRVQLDIVKTSDGMPPHHYHEMHGKPAHLVVVSEDLKTFAHVHPKYVPHISKSFDITLNKKTTEFDNLDVPTAMLLSGKYFLFAEVMPMEMSMSILPFEVKAAGPDRTLEVIKADEVQEDGSLLKYFDEKSNEVPEAKGLYKVVMNLEAVEHCGSFLPKFNLELFFRANLTSEFSQIKDLDPWLESYGHAVLIGASGTSAKEKQISHLHAVWPIVGDDGGSSDTDRGPYVELFAHSHNGPLKEDLYRAWIQVSHQGRVSKWPFNFNWKIPTQKLKTSKCKVTP